MSDPFTHPIPSATHVILPHSKWEREYQAFRRLLPDLLATYEGQYVAVHEQQVVDHDVDKIALSLRVLGTVGNVPIHVGLVSTEAEPVSRSGVRRDGRTSVGGE